jgi:CheY-like chemotaxis protein
VFRLAISVIIYYRLLQASIETCPQNQVQSCFKPSIGTPNYACQPIKVKAASWGAVNLKYNACRSHFTLQSDQNRIMVVDDEPDVANVIKIALERDGFVVDAFTDPKTALAQFKSNYYSMVISDIRMPFMNGFELYRELKKQDEKIKVAFMTAFDVQESEFRKVFANIDISCFFTKPVSMGYLASVIREQITTVAAE